jgi:hypothetical protein
MKRHNLIRNFCLLITAAVVVLVSCDDDSESGSDPYSVVISAQKIPGNGQYKHTVQSGSEVHLTIDVESEVPVTWLNITKKVNLEVDETFGENGVMNIPITAIPFEYDFHYVATPDDADQLVGFTFQVEDENGGFRESDLTLVVTLTPRDNIPRKRWLWKSLIDEEGNEAIFECDKDNSVLFNIDSTMVMNYGEQTAQGDCLFDGFIAYDKWHLTDDEQYFVVKKHNVFSPAIILTDSFLVKKLTVERLELEINRNDGYGTLLYVYTPTIK